MWQDKQLAEQAVLTSAAAQAEAAELEESNTEADRISI